MRWDGTGALEGKLKEERMSSHSEKPTHAEGISGDYKGPSENQRELQ